MTRNKMSKGKNQRAVNLTVERALSKKQKAKVKKKTSKAPIMFDGNIQGSPFGNP